MKDKPVAAATGSDSRLVAGVAQRFSQACAAAQLPMERDHQRHHSGVVDRHNARYDRGGT